MSATPLAAPADAVLTAPPPGRRVFWIAFALVLLALWFVKLPDRPLAHPDEGRLAPGDGRPYPTDARADDLLHWHTTLVAGDVELLARRLQAAGHSLVSPGVVTFRDAGLGFGKGFQLRDPDGHVMEVVDTWQISPSSRAAR